MRAIQQAGRDTGLVRAVGTGPLAATIVNGVVGAGIFSLPAAMAGLAGAWAPLALLLCALAVGAVALCAAEASGRIATSGGPSGYAGAAFGPVAAFVTDSLNWVGAVLACGGIAAALVDGLAQALPVLQMPVGRAGAIVAVLGGLALLNILGVKPAARAVAALTFVKLIPLLILVAVGGFFLLANGSAPAAAREPQALGSAFILALFAFSGMETALSASGEVRDPGRTIPRALLLATLFIAALYIAIQYVAHGLLGADLAGSATPLADAMGRVAPWFGLLLFFGASLSRFGWLGTDMLGAPRMLFAAASDGMLPRWLSTVNARTHAPQAAILVHAAVGISLAISGTFEVLAILSGLATAGIYILICASAWRLHGQDAGEGAGPVVRYRILPVAALVGIGSMIAIIAAGSRGDILGLLLMVVLSAAWGGYRAKKRA